MSERRRLGAAAVLLALACGAPTPARADEKTECADAGNAAGPLRDKGMLKEARDKLIRCAQASCPGVIRDSCAADLKAVEGEVPTIVLRATDTSGKDLAHVRVQSDGASLAETLDGNAIAVDPGPLKLRFSADGYEPKELDVVVGRGETDRVLKVVLYGVHEVRVPQPTPGKPSSASSVGAGPWVFLGVGGASLIAFAALEGVAQSAYAKLKSGCGASHSCTDAEVAPVRNEFIGAGVTLGVGSAAVAIAATWLIVHAATSGPKVAIGVGPGSFSLRGSF